MNLRGLHSVAPQRTGASADLAFEPESFDFNAHLGRRLGIDSELASELLGQWLRTYEPKAFGS